MSEYELGEPTSVPPASRSRWKKLWDAVDALPPGMWQTVSGLDYAEKNRLRSSAKERSDASWIHRRYRVVVRGSVAYVCWSAKP